MKKQIYLFIGISLLINLLQAFFTPISEDEAYYWLWSQNLDWGYFDHPPMVAWWVSLGYKLFQNELGVRLITVLLNSFSLFFWAQILNPKSINQIRLFAVITASTLVIQAFGFLSTPDAPLLFFTLFYLFSFKTFLEKNSLVSSLLLALSLAGLVYSKYHGILVIVFTLLPILKIWWKNPKLYFAVGLSILLYSPHILWLFQHDFIPIKYHFLDRSSDSEFEWQKPLIYLGIYFFGTAPFLSYFVFQSLFKFKSKTPFQQSIWWLAVLPGIFFFISTFKDNVQPQWLMISFIAMALLTYLYYAEKEKLKLLFILGITGVAVVILARISLATPGISPLYKYKQFAESINQYDVNNVVFEKYQEASVYNFYSPQKKVAVHRTIGNRKSQFSLWKLEERFHGKSVDFISPWTSSDRSFKGGHKNYEYHIKNIPNYISYELMEIDTPKELKAKPNQDIELEITIRNPHSHPLKIGGDSELKLNATYYQHKQYEILYSQEMKVEEFTLNPEEIKTMKVSFTNIDESGDYKVCLGINYTQIGTTYLSKPILLESK
ncbi:MAG: glycosyltransferase family 39 protein [Weeksellaceae bacterium]